MGDQKLVFEHKQPFQKGHLCTVSLQGCIYNWPSVWLANILPTDSSTMLNQKYTQTTQERKLAGESTRECSEIGNTKGQKGQKNGIKNKIEKLLDPSTKNLR